MSFRAWGGVDDEKDTCRTTRPVGVPSDVAPSADVGVLRPPEVPGMNASGGTSKCTRLHRVAVVGFGSGTTVLAVAILVAQVRGQIELPLVMLAIVFLCMGCFAVWVGLFHRLRTPAELEAADFPPRHPPSGDSLVSRFTGIDGRVKSVRVDFERESIMFGNCHTPRRFLAVAQPEWSCPFADLTAVRRCRFKGGDGLTILTTTGTALVPSHATGYETLCDRLSKCVPPEGAGHLAERPLLGLIYAFAAAGGLLLAPPFAAGNVSTGRLVMVMAAGAGIGITVIRVAVAVVVALGARRTTRRGLPSDQGA